MATIPYSTDTDRGEARFFLTMACAMAAIIVAFPAIGLLADKRRYGAVHPAWLCGIGSVLGLQVVADFVAYSDWGIAFTESFIAGTPGAERPMAAFVPAV